MLLQLVEQPLGLRVGEPVVLQIAHLAGRVGRQGIEERLAHAGIVIVAEAQLDALALDDLLQPLADVLERPGQVQHVLLLLPALLEPVAQRVQAGEAPSHPAPQQPLEGTVRAPAHEDLVAELLEHLGRVDLGTERVLCPIPARVAEPHAIQPTHARAEAWMRSEELPVYPMPRPVMSPRRVSPKQMNAANANGTQAWIGFAPGWVFCRSRASAWAMARIRNGPNPYT